MKDERNMEEMKRQYGQIPVPEELRGRLEKTIRQAGIEAEQGNVKEEQTDVARRQKVEKVTNMRTHGTIIKHIRKTAGAAAAAAIIFIAGVNTSMSLAYAVEDIPFIGAFARLVTFREYEVQKGTMEADIVTPQVEGLQDQAVEEQLNQKLTDYTDMLIAKFEADLAEQGEEGHESITTSHEILTDNENVFSMAVYVTQIQASDYQKNRYYTVDKSTGKILELRDLFAKGSDYQAVLTAEIQRQMREQMADDAGKTYFLDSEPSVSEQDFKELKEDAQFYITSEGKLVIAFDEYEVAPGYMGAQQFEIPTDAVKEILPEQRLLR